MRSLLLDGIEVRMSALSLRLGKAAPCSLLATVRASTTSAELVALMEWIGEGRLSGLRLEGLADVAVARRFPSIRYLEVSSEHPVDPRPLECLANLRGLVVDRPSKGIDFSCFPELEAYIGGWHVDNTNLRQESLSDLTLTAFNPRDHDLGVLRDLRGLVNLTLTRTTIQSLAGVEGLEDLRRLDIAYAPRLSALSALQLSSCGIRELGVSNAKSIEDYAPIASLAFLRRLSLTACAPMSSLDWVSPLERLSFLSFVDTNVDSGDLAPLLSLKSLRYVGTLDKRHYSHKSEDINTLLSSAANLPRSK